MSAAHSAASKARWAAMSPEKRAAHVENMTAAAAAAHANRSTKAVGLKRGNSVRIVIGLDADTFEIVRKRAVKNGVSFAEEVRTLIEWGLEEDA